MINSPACEIAVIVGAGGPAAPYALSVHENPRSGETEGISPEGKQYYPKPGQKRSYSVVGSWKYLEFPAITAISHAGELINNIWREIANVARIR